MTEQASSSRLHRGFYRNGDQHRGGADVSFQDVMRLFNFSSIHIGKWVTKPEQQLAANLFFDALCDLMDILQVPENVISLNGTLSIAFGVGGQKHASAHYNSAKRQLALAKNAGGGALAHEWFHAFDHFIGPKFITSTKPNEFASALWLDHKGVIKHPLNGYLEDCFQSIFLDANQQDQLSPLLVRSTAADKAVGTYYYSMPQELCARAFEGYIQDSSLKNEFLVKGTKKSEEAKLGLYPQGQQRAMIGTCFANYFRTLGFALENKK